MSYDSLALILSAAIFLITIFLLSFRAIGFGIAFLLLLFSLATGLIVGNMDVMREYFSKEKQHQTEQLQTNLTAKEKQIEQLQTNLTAQEKQIEQLEKQIEQHQREAQKEVPPNQEIDKKNNPRLEGSELSSAKPTTWRGEASGEGFGEGLLSSPSPID